MEGTLTPPNGVFDHSEVVDHDPMGSRSVDLTISGSDDLTIWGLSMPRGVPAGLPTAWGKAALRNAYSGARTSTTTHCCITPLCPYLVNWMPEHLNVQILTMTISWVQIPRVLIRRIWGLRHLGSHGSKGWEMAHRLNTVHVMCAATPAWAMYCTLPFSTGGHSLSHVSQDLPIPGSQVVGSYSRRSRSRPGVLFWTPEWSPPEVPNRRVDHDTGGALA